MIHESLVVLCHTGRLIELTVVSGATALGSVSNRVRKFQTDR